MGYICIYYKEVIVFLLLSYFKFFVFFFNFYLFKCFVVKYMWKLLLKESWYMNINVMDKILLFVFIFFCSEYRKFIIRLKCVEGNSD